MYILIYLIKFNYYSLEYLRTATIAFGPMAPQFRGPVIWMHSEGGPANVQCRPSVFLPIFTSGERVRSGYTWGLAGNLKAFQCGAGGALQSLQKVQEVGRDPEILSPLVQRLDHL